MFYEKVFKALNKNKIKYLVIGGVAVNLYGLTRLTRDLDIMIDLSSDLLDKFISVIGKLGYISSLPRHRWKALTAVAFQNKHDEFERIDIFLRNPIDFQKSYKARKIFKVKGLSISCVSLKDLLVLKNKAGRVRDWIDIGSLKRIEIMRGSKLKRN